MKKNLLTFAAVSLTLGTLGHFYAKPLLAQVRAALVQDVDQPARNFVQLLQVPVGVPVGTISSFFTVPIYTVPAGKRLTVDSLTLFNFDNTTAVPVEAQLGVGSGANCLPDFLFGFVIGILPVTNHGNTATGTPMIWGSANMSAYADQGQCVLITLRTNTPMSGGQGYFASMSGHLTSLP